MFFGFKTQMLVFAETAYMFRKNLTRYVINPFEWGTERVQPEEIIKFGPLRFSCQKCLGPLISVWGDFPREERRDSQNQKFIYFQDLMIVRSAWYGMLRIDETFLDQFTSAKGISRQFGSNSNSKEVNLLEIGCVSPNGGKSVF